MILSDIDPPENTNPYSYVPVRRGITEIETLRSLVSIHDGFIAGGYARYCLSPLPKPVVPSDVDVFCRTKEAYTDILNELKRRGAKVKVETVNAATLTPPDGWISCPTIQLINPSVMVGNPWSIISRFDFTVTIAALMGPDHGIAHKEFEVDEYAMQLKVNYIQCPVGNSRRMHKYLKKGYTISVKEMIKFFIDWETKSPERRKQILDLVDMKPEDWTEKTREDFRDLIYID